MFSCCSGLSPSVHMKGGQTEAFYEKKRLSHEFKNNTDVTSVIISAVQYKSISATDFQTGIVNSFISKFVVGKEELNMKRLLTGDRPTGRMHIGHYVGSLANRVKLQDEFDCFFIIADYQAITTHFNKTFELESNIKEVLTDWLAVGINPDKSTFFIQSAVPQLAELTVIFSMAVTVPRLYRNPTIKEEIKERGLGENVTYGFLGYPISQAADVLAFRPHAVPVGDDQAPILELTREIAKRFNKQFGGVFPMPTTIVPTNIACQRLPGTDGKRKMGKSYNNAIFLSDSAEAVKEKVWQTVTDPARIRLSDKGHPEVCTVFTYHEAFNEYATAEIANACRNAKIGCTECKKLLAQAIDELLVPIWERRAEYENQTEYLREIISEGNRRARKVAAETLDIAREAMQMKYCFCV